MAAKAAAVTGPDAGGGAHHYREDPLHQDFLFGAGATPPTSTAPPDSDALDDDTPTFVEVKDGFAEARAEAQVTQDIVDEFPRQMRRIAEAAGAAQGRKYGIIALIVAIIIATLASVAALSVAFQSADDSAAARVAAESSRQQVGAALGRLDEANGILTARGQAPVETPIDADPAGAIGAAVLAQVLAGLPPAPTADQIASRLQTTVSANVLGPTLDALAGEVAAYFEANPVRPPAPTEAQIRAAVDASLAENPPEPGEKGDPCLPSDPACVGPRGDDGPPGEDGRSVLTGPEPVRLGDGTCVLRVTYDQAPTVVEYPAGDSVCPDQDPVVTTPPPTTAEGPQGLGSILGR